MEVCALVTGLRCVPNTSQARPFVKLHSATKKKFSSIWKALPTWSLAKAHPTFKLWPQCPLRRVVLLEPSDWSGSLF